MRVFKYASAIIGIAMVSGCTGFEDNVTQGYATGKSIGEDGKTNLAFTTADVRLMTERARNNKSDDGRIFCAEPSPDAAMALSQALKLSASVAGRGEGSVESTNSQQITALAGRSVAVQALRDGTYRACEAYANGAIDRDGYALILSQYGDVLSTIMMGDDAAQMKSDAALTAISNNYIANAGPRFLHAAFDVCVAHKKVADTDKKVADTDKKVADTDNPFLDKICALLSSKEGLTAMATFLKDITPPRAPIQDTVAKLPATPTSNACSIPEPNNGKPKLAAPKGLMGDEAAMKISTDQALYIQGKLKVKKIDAWFGTETRDAIKAKYKDDTDGVLKKADIDALLKDCSNLALKPAG